MLTDEEAETIEQKLREGWRGPVLLKWLRGVLQDREERVQREQEGETHAGPIVRTRRDVD